MNALLAWRPWLIGAVAAAMFLTNLGGSVLFDEDEPKNAQCGVEMHKRGEWVVPTYNGVLREHKPVLLYWAMRASYAALGVSEFSARLPSALAGIAIVVMAYHLTRLLFDRTTGMLASMLLVSALMFAALMRASTPDGVLMISTTTALLAFVGGVAARRGGSFSGQPALETFQLPIAHTLVMYVAMGVAVLAKGPIGVLLPLWAICLYGLFGEPVDESNGSKRGFVSWLAAAAAPMRWVRGAWSIRMPLGLLLVAAVAGPWYAAVSARTDGAWLAGFIGIHNIGRFSNAMEGHSGPPYYYVVAVMAGFFPASCFLPAAVVGASWNRFKLDTKSQSYAFGLAVIAAYLSVFSAAATKLPNYVIPCYIGLAVVTAAWLLDQVRRFELDDARASIRTWLGAGMTSCTLVGVVLVIGLGVATGLLMGGSPLLGLVGLAPVVGGAIALVMLSVGKARSAVCAYAGGCLAFTFAGMTIIPGAVSPYRDGPQIAERIAAMEAMRGEPLTVATHRYTNPSLVWELDRVVPSLDAKHAAAQLADPDTVVAMSKEAYDDLEADLPPGVTTLVSQPRFMERDERIVLVGTQRLLAYVPHPSSLR